MEHPPDPETLRRLAHECREDNSTLRGSRPICRCRTAELILEGHDGDCPAAPVDAAHEQAIARTRSNLPALARALEVAAEMAEDAISAAGELRVSLDAMPPGSIMRRVVVANSIMRRERDDERNLMRDTREKWRAEFERLTRERDAALAEADQLNLKLDDHAEAIRNIAAERQEAQTEADQLRARVAKLGLYANDVSVESHFPDLAAIIRRIVSAP